MINLAVFNIKDLIKYIIKFCIIISIFFITIKIYKKKPMINIKENNLEKYNYTSCLDSTLPGIKQLNTKEGYKEQKNKLDPLKIALKLELEMLDNVVLKKDDIKQNNISNITGVNEKKEENEKPESLENIIHAEVGLSTQVIENNVPNKFTDTYNGVKIKNETDYNLTEEMLEPNIDINNENILIFHTHTCESYTPTEAFNYEQTGTFRTTDYNFNVVRVGTELENQLKSYNYNVVHDKTYHDYPSYSGSYERSLTTVQNLLTKNENTDIIIDLHRDAIGDYTYAPTVKIGEDYCSQLMFVIGSDGGGLEHPNWNQNLKFAVKVQEKANQLYPGLFKSIVLRNTRYNQHLGKAACIIEVGATGNTMEQCLNSMKYLSKVLSEVIK